MQYIKNMMKFLRCIVFNVTFFFDFFAFYSQSSSLRMKKKKVFEFSGLSHYTPVSLVQIILMFSKYFQSFFSLLLFELLPQVKQ